MKGGTSGILAALCLLGLDQLSKGAVERFLSIGQSVSVTPFFSLTHIQNTGAAFGILAQSNGMLVGLTAVILIFLLKAHKTLVAEGAGSNMGVSFIWAGALGNLMDRLRRGAVTDFLDVHWRHWHWPAFNVADSAITVGVGLLLLQNFSRKKP